MEQGTDGAFELILEAEAASCRGQSHERNEDAYLVDIEGGLFAVADGMGGHRDGHVASNAVMSVLSQTLVVAASLEEKIETATRAIESVNASLYAQSRSSPGMDISGSTAVALIVAERYACCLWAGDSRLYLFRKNNLFLVSEDHGDHGGALTRAVGSAATLEVDRRIVEVKDGDIFLLCSDGLLKGIDEGEIVELLGQTGAAPADRLLAKAIAGGSSDDITLVLVWVGLRDE
jgi:serine/threonine protein phosphatase PrpC